MEPNDLTLLILSTGLAPYSARGLSQTLDPIAASVHLERAVDGTLIDLSAPQMRKYRSKITCTDQNTPAMDGLWPGMQVTVSCVAEMSFPTASPGLQGRTAVAGSVRTEGDFTFYRPILTMVFMGFNTTNREFEHDTAWSIDLEEL